MHCWNCGSSSSPISGGRLSFRERCESCGADLHCCKNCKHHASGRPNECSVPGTDPIRDRTANNFCDEFSLSGIHRPAQALNKQRFEDLFK